MGGVGGVEGCLGSSGRRGPFFLALAAVLAAMAGSNCLAHGTRSGVCDT